MLLFSVSEIEILDEVVSSDDKIVSFDIVSSFSFSLFRLQISTASFEYEFEKNEKKIDIKNILLNCFKIFIR